jgi:hypothetical protein
MRIGSRLSTWQWSTLILLLIIIALLLLLLNRVQPRVSVAYFVAKDCTAGLAAPNCTDANNGTSRATAKLTIQAGVNLMGSQDTLILGNGTYSEHITISSAKSGTASVHTTIQAENRNMAILTPAATTIGNGFIFNANYVTVDGVKVDCQNLDCAPYINQTFPTTIHDIWLINGSAMNTKGDGTANGEKSCIELGAGGSHRVINMDISGCGTTAGQFDHSIYISSSNNIVDGNRISGGGAGEAISDYGGGGTPTRTNNIYRNNVIHDNAAPGLLLSQTISNYQVYNNLIYNNTGMGMSLFSCGISNSTIAFNTIHQNSQYGIGISSSCSFSSTVVRNNNITGNGWDPLGITGSGITCDHNIGVAGGETTTNVCNAVASSTDPLYMNAATGDFRISSGSPSATPAGVTISTITTDINGLTRPSPPSIGAHEYDAGATPSPGGTVDFVNAFHGNCADGFTCTLTGVPVGAEQVLLVSYYQQHSSDVATGCTFNGVGMTSVVGVLARQDKPPTGPRAGIYNTVHVYAAAPAAATASIVCAQSSTSIQSITAVIVSGADRATPVRSHQEIGTGYQNSTSLTLTSQAGDLAVSFVNAGYFGGSDLFASACAPTDASTERVDQDGADSGKLRDCAATKPATTTSTTIGQSWSSVNPTTYVHVALDIALAPVVNGTPPVEVFAYPTGTGLTSLNGGMNFTGAWSCPDSNWTVETAPSGGPPGGNAARVMAPGGAFTAACGRGMETLNAATVTFYLRPSTCDWSTSSFFTLREAGNDRMNVRLSGGNFQANNNGTFVTVGPCNANAWNRIDIQFDDGTQAEKFRVKVNSGTYSSYFTVLSGAYVVVDSLVIYANSTTASITYFDGLGVDFTVGNNGLIPKLITEFRRRR